MLKDVAKPRVCAHIFIYKAYKRGVKGISVLSYWDILLVYSCTASTSILQHFYFTYCVLVIISEYSYMPYSVLGQNYYLYCRSIYGIIPPPFSPHTRVDGAGLEPTTYIIFIT